MLGLLPPVIVVALIIGGFYYWAQRRRDRSATPGSSASTGGRRISLITEAMAYVGSILVLAGAITAVGQRWDDMTDWGHVAVFTGAALFFLIIGLLVRRVREPAVQRVIGVVWLLSTAGVAGAVGFAAYQVAGWTAETTTLSVGLATSAYAAVLWLIHRAALQNAALFTAFVVTIVGVNLVAVGDTPPSPSFVLALWAFGTGWAVLAWRHVIEPLWTGLPLGTVLALTAPSIGVADHGWLYAVAITSSAAVMALSVPTRNPLFLGLGTLATFGYVTAVVIRYFGDQLGVPATLAITGVLIIALAVVSARLMRAVRPRTASRQPSEHALTRTPTRTP
ncbi:MAG: hypothetical protein HOV77_06750 [Hamadaea sp.]|uniref:hypothetical protein n=1 Tax=Hamadaea sp. TaxID=2024425 RepID=UPI001824BA7D|nr:hypothetical protein [Hamadaea sp.]NUT18866.1 hypothetical protein [Hamadaea sp.]